jgi:hypothetical protein
LDFLIETLAVPLLNGFDGINTAEFPADKPELWLRLPGVAAFRFNNSIYSIISELKNRELTGRVAKPDCHNSGFSTQFALMPGANFAFAPPSTAMITCI